MSRALAAALLVLAACGGRAATSKKVEFAVAKGLRPQILAVPADAGADFAACLGAKAYVPYRGGVVAAGWNGWLVEPSDTVIQSVACDEDEHVYGVSATELAVLAEGAWRHIVSLPDGAWHVESSPDGHLWLWGKRAGGDWQIHEVRPDGPFNVYSAPTAITAAGIIGKVGLLAAIDQVLVAFSAQGDAKPLVKLDAAPDGLAVLPTGEIFVSVSGSIMQLRETTGLSVMATGLHGVLRARHETLYVRSVEDAAVIRLSPDIPR